MDFCSVITIPLQSGSDCWVIYKYRDICRWPTEMASHSIMILRWLPSKLAEWIGDNMSSEQRIPAKTQAKGKSGNSIRS